MSSNRVLEALRQASAALDSIPLQAYAELSSAEHGEVLAAISRHEARTAGHKLAATRAAAVSEAARAHGAATTGALLATTFGGDRGAGDRLVHQAERMAETPATEQALSRGLISAGQADVIASTVAGLPKDLSAKDRQTCEDTLIAAAPTLSIKDLRRRADRIADVYAPDEVDAIENKTLVAREKAAWAKTEFWMVDRHDGTHKGGFVLPDLPAEQLQKMVDVLMAPRNQEAGDDPVLLDTRPTAAQRSGFAFADLIQRYPTQVLPGANGVGAQLMIDLDYDTLCGAVLPATLETGTRLSAQEAMRLACDLGVVPAVFDGKPLPLHLGREARLFSRAQRRAMAKRDGGCAFPGCDRPPGWCEAHHANGPWCGGGQTDLGDGVLVCSFHHRLLHHTGWDVRVRDGIPEFLPPPELDPKRRPRRNSRYRREPVQPALVRNTA